MFSVLFYSEINLVCMLILSMLCLKLRHSMFLQAHRQLLFREMAANILLFGLDLIWILVDKQVLTLGITANWILNAAYYVLTGLLGLFWFAYSETVQESAYMHSKRVRQLAALPMVLLALLTLCSLKTGWLFYIDANNVYHRGPFYALQVLLAYGYVFFTAAKAFINSFKTELYRKKSELRTLSIFVVPTLVAGTLQTIVPGLPVLCVGNTLGLLYVYLTMLEQMISVDPLTRLNNRNQLYQCLSSKLSHPNGKKALYLLMMDVDWFKAINDQYGHVEGDRALKLVAECLMRACNRRNYFLARFGGDEFIILCELDPGESVENTVCKSIYAELEKLDTPYKLSLSIGCARYTDEVKNQQEFIALADKELYRMKQLRHKSADKQ